MHRILFLLLAVPWLASAQDAELPQISASDSGQLLANEGKRAVVAGFIESTGTSASGIHFLNFRGSEFVCVVFARDLAAFGENSPAEVYAQKHVEVRGEIELYRGNPQIKLASPDQISVQEQPQPENAEKPPETPQPAPKTESQPEPEAKSAKSASDSPAAPDVELIDGVPPVDWRKYFSDDAKLESG